MLHKVKKTFGRFLVEAPRAYKCKQILGICQSYQCKQILGLCHSPPQMENQCGFVENKDLGEVKKCLQPTPECNDELSCK